MKTGLLVANVLLNVALLLIFCILFPPGKWMIGLLLIPYTIEVALFYCSITALTNALSKGAMHAERLFTVTTFLLMVAPIWVLEKMYVDTSIDDFMRSGITYLSIASIVSLLVMGISFVSQWSTLKSS